jgi:hypothetical protein
MKMDGGSGCIDAMKMDGGCGFIAPLLLTSTLDES